MLARPLQVGTGEVVTVRYIPTLSNRIGPDILVDCRGFASIIGFHIFRNLLEIDFSQIRKYLIINHLNTSCGVINKFLTNFDDFRAVYLFGIQIDIE